MKTRMLCINIRIVTLLAALGLVPAANADYNVVWNGANGECALDDSTKWSGWKSWNDSTAVWIISRSKTGQPCTATMSGDLTMTTCKNFTIRDTGPLTFSFPYTLTLPSFGFNGSYVGQTITMTQGTLTLAGKMSMPKNNHDVQMTFTGPSTVFNGNLEMIQHTNSCLTIANGARWNGTLDSQAGGDKIIVTGAGSAINGKNGNFRLGGSLLNGYIADASMARYFRGMRCEILDGAAVTNCASFYIGYYGNHVETLVSNASLKVTSAYLGYYNVCASNCVLRLKDRASVALSNLTIGYQAREQICDVDGGSILTVDGDNFVMGTKSSSHQNRLFIHGGAAVTNKATNTYIGTSSVRDARVEVTDGGEFYCTKTVCVPTNSGEGSCIAVSDGGRFISTSTVEVGEDNVTVAVPNELYIGANGTGTVNAVSFQGRGNRVVVSNGTLNVSSIATRNTSGNTLAVMGAKARLTATGDISISANDYELELRVPKEGFADTPIQCAGSFTLKNTAILDLSVERGINGSWRIIKADGGIDAGSSSYLTSLIARWNEELKAQKDFKLSLELKENNTELWLNARTKGGLILVFR